MMRGLKADIGRDVLIVGDDKGRVQCEKLGFDFNENGRWLTLLVRKPNKEERNASLKKRRC